MNLNRIHSIYFIGIGGIGMSALAKYFLLEGKKVAGYDKTHSAVTRELQERGISIDIGEDDTFNFGDADIIVYTPAVAPDSRIRKSAEYSRIPMYKRAEVLGEITRSSKTLAVAGSHGKTTTAALLTKLIDAAGKGVKSFIGGRSLDYNSNFVYDSNAEYTVTEADEYDRSFLYLNPSAAIITSVDPDHMDIYGSEAELRRSFMDFARNVSSYIIIHEDAAVKIDIPVKYYTYGFSATSDFHIKDHRIIDGRNRFSLATPNGEITGIEFGIPGRHNLLNAAAATALTSLLFPEKIEEIKSGLRDFKGVYRRFELICDRGGRTYIDDYAHHPKEIDAAISTARTHYPERALTVVFQPHLFSRTRDFMEDFAVSLSKADKVFLPEIYPAREKPIHGVTSAVLTEKINALKPVAEFVPKDELCEKLKIYGPELLLTLGAGDIETLREPVKEEVFS